MKIKHFLSLASAFCAVVSMADIKGSSPSVAIDLTVGTRTAAATEKIAYSPKWNSSAADAAAVVSIEGEEVARGSAAGVYEWKPTRNGTYTLTHKVEVAGAQVGETLSSTFVVEGLHPETPVISPVSGTVISDTSLTVSMSCASEGGTIHYTTNGTTPTVESATYKKFRIYGKTTVKAIAFYDDGTPSDMAVAEYALGQCADPVISLADGSVFQHSNQVVSISGGADGTLRYTLDGSEPTAESPVYAGPFTISETTTVKAKVFSDSFFDSQVVTSTLTREWVKVTTPTATTSVASSGLSVLVDLGCVDPDAELHYTLDGSEPTAESPIYTTPFYAFDAVTLKVVAVRDDFANSDILTNDIAIYCVVDLSDGSTASSYPVSYIVGIPTGGWTDEYKTTKLVLRKINAGSFIMGEDQTNEANRVTLAKPFYTGVFEVTQKQYALITGESPSHFVGDALPVEAVSYGMIRGNDKGVQYPEVVDVDADSFMGKLRARTGLLFDLPSERQWEYVCRAGTTTVYSYGDTADGAYMWYNDNSGSTTHNVGTRLANPWGLYDMHGNVWEWCLDWYGDLSMQGSGSDSNRVERGGSWFYGEDRCRSFFRYKIIQTRGDMDRGFRLFVEAQYPHAPVVSPVSGTTFDTSLTVTMSCASEGATIHYTTNGTTPTVESAIYKKFRIYGKTTVKAIAFYEDGTPSEMAVAEYALGQCADPVISLADGSVFTHSNQVVSISGGADGTLRYTLDGSEPTAESPVYAGPFTISETTTVKAKVFSDSFFDSQVVMSTLTREWETVATPVITAASSFMGSKTQVSISCATVGAQIRYTTDGSDPSSLSAVYTGVFNVTTTCTVKAYAVLADYTDSAIATQAIEKIWGIGDSVGAPDQVFTTSGDQGWVRDTGVSQDGSESMRSGAIQNSQTSVLATTVNGKGTVSFWWMTSCEEDEEYHDWDHAECAFGGERIAVLDGITKWQQVTHTFTTDGDHTITWTYVKDDTESAGEDCVWMDAFAWTPVPSDPIPEIPSTATAADIAKALEGSADPGLTNNITTVANYNAYRTWATAVTLAGGGLAGKQAVKDSPHAWLSFALDSAVLMTKAPEQGEMKIAAFEKNATTGKFDFAVKIEGVNVGTGATAENLAKVFWLEGSTAVDGDYSDDNVVFTFGTPVGGKVALSALPADETATQFFMKVKMEP